MNMHEHPAHQSSIIDIEVEILFIAFNILEPFENSKLQQCNNQSKMAGLPGHSPLPRIMEFFSVKIALVKILIECEQS